MENKIPVGSVVAQSLGFPFRRLLTLLRLGWLPVGLAVIVTKYAPEYIFTEAITESIPFLDIYLLGMPIFTSLLAFIPMIVFGVVVHQLILEEDSVPRGWFYFRFSGREIRYFVATILIALLSLVFYGLGIFALLGEAWAASISGDGTATGIQEEVVIGPINIAGFVVAILCAVFVATRMSLLLPIVVAENGVNILRTWTLSSGNFWRIIGAYIVLGLLLYLIFAIIILAGGALIFSLSRLGPLSETMSFENISIVPGFIWAAIGIVSEIIYTIVATAMTLSLLSFMYQALTDEGVSASERVAELRGE